MAGGSHPSRGWEIILHMDPRQLRFAWACVWQEDASMAPSLALPGGNKHGFPRERQQKLSEKERILLFLGLKRSTKSLSLEVARERRLLPTPQSIFCT